jgi:hypothetical protein
VMRLVQKAFNALGRCQRLRRNIIFLANKM